MNAQPVAPNSAGKLSALDSWSIPFRRRCPLSLRFITATPVPPNRHSGSASPFLLIVIALVLVLVLAFEATAADGAPVSDPAASHPLLAWLFNFFASATVVVGGMRILIKPFQSWLQGFFTELVARVVESEESDDDALLRKVFSSLWYRAAAFAADYLLSLKLPTSKSLNLHRS